MAEEQSKEMSILRTTVSDLASVVATTASGLKILAGSVEKQGENITGLRAEFTTAFSSLTGQVSSGRAVEGRVSSSTIISVVSAVAVWTAIVIGVIGSFGNSRIDAVRDLDYMRDMTHAKASERENEHQFDRIKRLEDRWSDHESEVRDTNGRQWEMIKNNKFQHDEHVGFTRTNTAKIDDLAESIYRHQGFSGHQTKSEDMPK